MDYKVKLTKADDGVLEFNVTDGRVITPLISSPPSQLTTDELDLLQTIFRDWLKVIMRLSIKKLEIEKE